MAKHNEYTLQCSCLNYFDLQYPKLEKNYFHIHNEGTSASRGAFGKKMGIRSGIADTFLAVARQGFNGLFIEFKSEKGRQSPEQKLFEQAVTAQGYGYVVIRDFLDFKIQIDSYLRDER